MDRRGLRDAIESSRVHALFVLQFDTGHVNGMNYERRIARILLLGIISGFSWVLIGSSLSLWLKEDGISRSTIGWAGLIFGVYAFNFLWAPLIDRIQLPWLSVRLGHRRAWIVTLQAVILVCLVLWSSVEPTANLTGVIAIGLVIAIASATQDITIDALRIEQFGQAEGESMAAGAATAVVGWWTGFKLGGVVALETAAFNTSARCGQSRFSGRPPSLYAIRISVTSGPLHAEAAALVSALALPLGGLAGLLLRLAPLLRLLSLAPPLPALCEVAIVFGQRLADLLQRPLHALPAGRDALEVVAVSLAVGQDALSGLGETFDLLAPLAVAVMVGDLVAELDGHDFQHVVAVLDPALDRREVVFDLAAQRRLLVDNGQHA